MPLTFQHNTFRCEIIPSTFFFGVITINSQHTIFNLTVQLKYTPDDVALGFNYSRKDDQY